MIDYKFGNMWDANQTPNTAITIAVNIGGVAGAGQALQFKQQYPDRARRYMAICRQGMLKIGKPFIDYGSPNFIYFPTKRHYSGKTKITWIERGLVNLMLNPPDVSTIHLPALGCGLGGLEWEDFATLLELYLGKQPISYVVWRY